MEAALLSLKRLQRKAWLQAFKKRAFFDLPINITLAADLPVLARPAGKHACNWMPSLFKCGIVRRVPIPWSWWRDHRADKKIIE